MNFRTQVELPQKEMEICHSDRMLLFGSCFAESLGNLLMENKFSVDKNPFGVLYNPLSIAEALRELLIEKHYNEEDVFFSNGLWNSWMHHSSFSSLDRSVCLEQINERLSIAITEIQQADIILITWGTAWVYELKTTGKVVGNCHKQPDILFTRRLLPVHEIVDTYKLLINTLREINSHVRIVLTISPIRHAKDGLHGNQVSKSTLILAAHEIINSISDCFYFPSYEIMMDELRDYRFYADDMVHPSSIAVRYIWECFQACYFTQETLLIMKKWQEIAKGLAHRPYNPHAETYRQFLSEIVLKISRLKEKYPFIELQKEEEKCQTLLSQFAK